MTVQDDEIRARQRRRATVMGVLLGGFAVLVFLITIVKMEIFA